MRSDGFHHNCNWSYFFASFAGGNNKKKDGYIQKKPTNANDCTFGLSRDKCEVFFKFLVLNISMILKELHFLFVKNKIIQANSSNYH